jgi:tetratricopeptide (TPR) repeat protein
MSLHRQEDALLAYEKAIEYNGSMKIDAWLAKASLLMRMGKENESLLAYEEALNLDPKNALAWAAMSMDLRTLGRNSEADAALAKAWELGYKPSYLQEKIADYYFRRGQELHENESYQEAVLAYDRALELDPKNETVWFFKGNSLYALAISSSFQMSIFEDALEAYDRAIELDPNYAQPWWGKSRTLDLMAGALPEEERAKAKEEALKAVDNALEIDPNFVEALIYKGTLLDNLALSTKNRSKYNDSILAFEKALKITPAEDTRNLALAWEGKALALTHMANDLADQGQKGEAEVRRKEALECYDKAIKLDPDFTGLEARMNKASVLGELGRYNESVAILDEAIETAPANLSMYAAILWADKGSVLGKMGEHEKALEALDKATSLDPNNPITWISKSDLFRTLGREAEAEAASSKAKELGYAG